MKRLFSFLTTLIISTVVYPQEKVQAPAIKDTINLNEVVVTGTTVKVNKRYVPLSVSVVNNLQISQSVESDVLPILNGRVPGLFVTERGVMGFGVATNAAGQISIRGIGGSPTTGVLVLIDGHPQYMGIFGHPLSDSYVSSDIERVEVIRGPASLLYGSNAMGGVINLITKAQSNDGLTANAHLMYGSYNTQKYMASVGYRKNKVSLFASVNHDQTDGHRPNSDFDITNGYLKFSYDLNKNIKLNSDLSLVHFKASDPGPDTVGAVPGSKLDIKRGYWSLSMYNNYEKYSGTARFFYNFGVHNISDGFHSNDANYGINLYEAVKLFKGNSITIGTDYTEYGGKAENELAMGGQGMIFKDTTLFDAGFYGFVQQTLFGKLTLNAGLRLQHHQVFGNTWVPAGGMAFRISNATTLKASIGKGFRNPTIQELYIWNHNPNLNPEKIMSYETGILQSLFHQKLKLELTGYIIKGNNLIINIPLAGLENAGEILNKGIEFSASVNLLDNLDLNATYSYIHMKSPVYATPRNHLFFSGGYHLSRFLFSTSVEYVNHLDTDPSADTRYQTYTLLNSKITYQAGKHAWLFMSADNILNQIYENNIYYPMPGITVFGGIKLRL